MAEDRPARTLEPGTLDKTRQNIGPIDAIEALEMQKKLGGEILKERSAPIDTSNMPKRRNRPETVIRASGKSSSEVAASTSISSAYSSSSSSSSSPKPVKKIMTDAELPEISARDLKLMNKLMMSPGYDIKPDYGIFNFIYMMSAKNKEKLQPKFGSYIIHRHVEHMQGFISTIKTFIQIAPDTYKAKIATETDLKFKFLRTVGKWTMRDIKVLAIDIENSADYLTLPMLIPFIKAVYRQLLTIYYIGEQQVSLLIKEIYADLGNFPNADKGKIQTLAKQATTEWLYVHDQVIKGLYPIIMRMCSPEYDEFPSFFKSHIAEILKFLNLSKFDLLLPEKKKKEEKKTDEKKNEKKVEHKIAGAKDEVVSMGIKILEQLFPMAGFSHLERYPDLYPYFQPLYNFPDGFNMLHPHNPLQVTMVLVRIVEDLIKGLRNVKFNIEADENLAAIQDKLNDALNEWVSYLEDLFERKFGDYLKTYVNSIYSQKDFENTKNGRETLNNIYWRAKYYFLPHYKFSAPVLLKPINDSKIKPLFGRTDYIRTVFSTLVKRIDENSTTKGTVLGVLNPWEKYKFDLSNTVSKRIDVLLGANRDISVSAATNANLIKYTLCIISVLDWWINNPTSPAYLSDPKDIYRISEKDGAPLFSVDVRTDQNQLFAEGVKKAIAAKKSK